MAHFIDSYWPSSGEGITRRDRQGCSYSSYMPDRLMGRPFTLDGDVAADVADAEAAIIRLNSEASSLASTEVIARILLRAEALASSRIEGLSIGARRLLRVEAAREFEASGRDVTADEVLGNVDAMAQALTEADTAGEITTETILRIHASLLTNTPLAEHAGHIREVQNWIGRSHFNPCAADYVPPPPEAVPELLADLADFCSGDSLPAVAQAAVAHAQFETIHPFVDGNGRAGRALIHLILRRRGIAPQVVPPVSLILATLASDYVGGLNSYRHEGSCDTPAAQRGLNRWVAFFAGCCTRAVKDSSAYDARIRAIQTSWRQRLTPIRRGSSVDLLIDLLPGTPIVTITSVASSTGRTFNAARRAVGELVAAGVLRQTTVGRRNRAFEADEVIDAFTSLERQLASPRGDTAVDAPTRAVPDRRPGRRK